jgi:hypothetical protein
MKINALLSIEWHTNAFINYDLRNSISQDLIYKHGKAVDDVKNFATKNTKNHMIRLNPAMYTSDTIFKGVSIT